MEGGDEIKYTRRLIWITGGRSVGVGGDSEPGGGRVGGREGRKRKSERMTKGGRKWR